MCVCVCWVFFSVHTLFDYSADKVKRDTVEVLAKTYFPNNTQAVADKIVEKYISSQNVSSFEQFRDAVVQVFFIYLVIVLFN